MQVLVVVPTYDERDSLPGVLARLLRVPGVDVLVVDDGSPDGTGQLADRLALTEPRITVLHRPGKAGLGTAYLAGFAEAMARGADVVVEFDADGSHQPEQLPALLRAVAAGADLAIGTRWMPGGRVLNWPRRRRLISRTGTRYARFVLGSHLRDITSGYRAIRVDALRRPDFALLHSHGYCFQIELAWNLERMGHPITEVPITFVERTAGASKMSTGIVAEAMLRVTLWGLERRVLQVRRRIAPARPT